MLFAGDLSMEEDLQEEVTELFGEFGVVGGVEGVKDFVGLFDQVSAESGVGLLAVPGAAARSTEASHDGDEFFEVAADVRVRFRRALLPRGFCGGFAWFVPRFSGSHEPVQDKFEERFNLRWERRFDKRADGLGRPSLQNRGVGSASGTELG